MSRGSQLVRLGHKTYADYLASDHWKEVRRRYRESGRPLECVCGEPSDALHHQTYERLGCEELDDLIPLCRRCHGDIHDLERRGVSGLSVDALRDQEQAAVYAEQLAPRRAKAAREFMETEDGSSSAFGSVRRKRASPLADMLRELEEAHHAGVIDASVCLAAVERRIEVAEVRLRGGRNRGLRELRACVVPADGTQSTCGAYVEKA